LPTTASQSLWDAAYTARITTANAPLSINSNTIRIDTATRFTGVATLGKAYNDSLVLSAAIATKVNKADSIAGGYYPYSSNPKGYLTTVTTPTLNQVLTAGNTSTQPIAITNGTGISVTNGSQTSYQQPNQFLLKGTTYQGSLSSATLFSNQIWTFPNNTGTVALTSDITGGTVTSVATGLGLSGGTITATGTLLVDTSSASILSRQRAAATYAPISINGTVTSVARTNGLGISASVANSTTTPNITIAVDTSDASILSRQRASATYLTSSTAAATYLPLTGGTLSSRLTGTSLILNKDSLPTVTGKTWGLVIDTGNSNRISRQILPTATGTVTSITLGRGITGSSPITTTGTIGIDTSKNYTWTGGNNTFNTQITTPLIVGGTTSTSGVTIQTTSAATGINPNDFNVQCKTGSTLYTALTVTGTTGNIGTYGIVGLGTNFRITGSSTSSLFQCYAGATYLGQWGTSGFVMSTKASVFYNGNPTANLHIGAGSSSASGSPFKITTGGALLSSTEANTFETDDSYSYWTSGSTRVKIAGAGTPTISAGAGAGTSPTVSVTGSDRYMKVSITTGTIPTLSATVATIIFNKTFGSSPSVIFSAANANAATLNGVNMVYMDAGGSSTQFVITSGTTALTAATTYVWNVTCGQ
jgi:hypothetical protein